MPNPSPSAMPDASASSPTPPPRIRSLRVLSERIRYRRNRLAKLVERNVPTGVLQLEMDVLFSLMAERAQRQHRLDQWASLGR